MTFDIGSNLTGIAYLFLFLKFLMPYVIGIILLIIAGIGGAYFYNKFTSSSLTPQQIFYGIVGAGLLLLILILR